jgi:hypothetical protein
MWLSLICTKVSSAIGVDPNRGMVLRLYDFNTPPRMT